MSDPAEPRTFGGRIDPDRVMAMTLAIGGPVLFLALGLDIRPREGWFHVVEAGVPSTLRPRIAFELAADGTPAIALPELARPMAASAVQAANARLAELHDCLGHVPHAFDDAGTPAEAARRAGAVVAALGPVLLRDLAEAVGVPAEARGRPTVADPRPPSGPGAGLIARGPDLATHLVDLVYALPDGGAVRRPVLVMVDRRFVVGGRGPAVRLLDPPKVGGLAGGPDAEPMPGLLRLWSDEPQPWACADPGAAAAERLLHSGGALRDGLADLWLTREEAEAAAGRPAAGLDPTRAGDLRAAAYAATLRLGDGAPLTGLSATSAFAATFDGSGQRPLPLCPARLFALAAAGGEGVVDALTRLSGPNAETVAWNDDGPPSPIGRPGRTGFRT